VQKVLSRVCGTKEKILEPQVLRSLSEEEESLRVSGAKGKNRDQKVLLRVSDEKVGLRS
jgi:hypothetical protein